jgi:nuclear pore complex protein Nup93
MFGTNPAQPAQSTSLLGGTQSAQQNQQTDSAATGQTQTREGAYFNSLLERQKKKVKLDANDPSLRRSQLPNLNMDLGDLARRAQELGNRGQATNGSDSRAHYLLAGSGVAPGQSSRGFKPAEQDAPAQSYAAMPDHVFETETYIRNLQAKGRDAIMRENMERVYKEVDAYIEQSLGVDFEEQKTRIMRHFGLLKDDEGQTGAGQSSAFGRKSAAGGEKTRSVFGRSGLNKSIIGSAASINGTSGFFRGTVSPLKGGALLRGQNARDLRDKERMFIEQVEQFNNARISRSERTAYPIMEKFGQVEANSGGDSPPQLAEAYNALREITKEGGSVTERQYAAAYIHQARGPELSDAISKQILDGARSHLEKSFFREVESMIEKNPREAQLGGQPTVINKIRAYIRVRAARRDLAPDGAELQQIGDSGEYCWILIFYLIRAGYIREASEYVNNDPAFRSTDTRFVSYMSSYASSPDRKLTKNLQPMIDGEYSQRVKLAPKGTVDPYRMACYKVVGRCDLDSRNLESIGQGIEDWLWLQFALARQLSRSDDLAGTPFGLEQIQETVTEIGEKHFPRGQSDASTAYGTFFLLQVLAGMFEQAIDYLHAFNPVSAVHFAIALSYYGLLRPVADFTAAANELCKSVTFSEQDCTNSLTVYRTTTEQYQINFVPLIAYYTAGFRIALPVAAVDYLSLICLNADLKPHGDDQIRACHESLRELCLETREFARLLGDIRSDGARVPGAIEQRRALIKIDSKQEFLRSIITQSAAVADQRGQIADAVLLYHLCEDYDSVVGVLCRALADAVSLDLGETPMQLQPLKPRSDQESTTLSPQSSGPTSSLSLTQSTTSPIELAKNMAALYNKTEAYFGKISHANRETCGGLLRLAAIRTHLEADPPRYMPALQELNELDVLPLEAKGSIPKIRSAASMFGAMPPLLARCIGVAVVWAVKAIGGERDRIVRQGSWDAGYGNEGDGVKEQLGSMAKDLMVFAGLVKYKLPSRVYDLLTKAGGDVGGY